jgi:hypothetical protein
MYSDVGTVRAVLTCAKNNPTLTCLNYSKSTNAGLFLDIMTISNQTMSKRWRKLLQSNTGSVEFKVKILVLNYAPLHADVWGSGGSSTYS